MKILKFMQKDKRFIEQENTHGRRWFFKEAYIMFKHFFGGWVIHMKDEEMVFCEDDIDKFKSALNL